MAVTGKYRLPEENYPQQGYQGLAGVSDNTAQKAQKAQQDYQPNQQVQQAQQQLQNVQNQRPQSYNSKYSAALDGILKEIQQPKEFKYSFNGDELFKYYADLYTQQGKQAAADVMGSAAALTGGYGNSYGQQVGQQTYDQYLLNLYDKGMDLRDRAYQKYRDDQAALQDQYNMLSAADQTDYGRYRDTLGDWENERAYWTQQEGTAYDRGYNEFLNERNYWTQQAAAENADWWNGQQMAENIRQYDTSMAENIRQYDTSMAENQRQFDANLDYEKMTNDQKYAAEYAMAILQNGEMPTLALLKAAGLSEEDAQKLMAQLVPAGGGSGGRGKGNSYYVDIAGNYYTVDKNGNYVKVDDKDIDPRRDMEYGSAADIAKTTARLATGNKTWAQAAEEQKEAKKAAAAAEAAAAENAAARQKANTTEAVRNTMSNMPEDLLKYWKKNK